MAVICHACQQRPATLHLTEPAMDGSVAELHVCDTCAAANQILAGAMPPTLTEIRRRLQAPVRPAAERRCGGCGLTMADYGQSHVLGCARCWTDLRPGLMALVRRFHEADRHAGRGMEIAAEAAPSAADAAAAQRRTLERNLRMAVAEERFEEAARLRDQLRRLGGDA